MSSEPTIQELIAEANTPDPYGTHWVGCELAHARCLARTLAQHLSVYMEHPSQKTLHVLGCSRCGQDHNITFVRLAEPKTFDDDGLEYPFAGVCANTAEIVWMRDVEDANG